MKQIQYANLVRSFTSRATARGSNSHSDTATHKALVQRIRTLQSTNVEANAGWQTQCNHVRNGVEDPARRGYDALSYFLDWWDASNEIEDESEKALLTTTNGANGSMNARQPTETTESRQPPGRWIPMGRSH